MSVTNQSANQTSSNRAASANQHNTNCLSVENVRWRKATSRFQIGIRDLAAAGKDETLRAAAQRHIDAAAAELDAVTTDDNRIGSKTNPLCPYVVGRPDLTPSKPVHPTPAKPQE